MLSLSRGGGPGPGPPAAGPRRGRETGDRGGPLPPSASRFSLLASRFSEQFSTTHAPPCFLVDVQKNLKSKPPRRPSGPQDFGSANVSNASGDRTAERHAAAVASTFATCYTTGIAARMGAAPAGGAVGAVAGSWRGGGKLARWRGAACRSPLGVKPVAAHSNSSSAGNSRTTATSDSKAIRKH